MSEVRTAKGRLEIRQSLSTDGDATLLRLAGSIDETFTGFDTLPSSTTAVVLELSGLTRITSYGVRQWIRGRDQLSTAAKQVYYLNCPPVFIDQLNMVLNFGGRGQVITAAAPFSCSKCHREERPLIDVLKAHDELALGRVAAVPCSKCSAPMEMDELPETYFGFVKTAGARGVTPAVAALLAQNNLYTGAPIATDGPPVGDRASVQKLVHDRVTYFRVGGMIDKRFRARALLEGTEGEVVLDLRELAGVADDSREEWERLRAGLVQRASVVTVLDVPPVILDAVAKGLSLKGTVVYSILAPHKCDGCGRRSDEPIVLLGGNKGAPANTQRVCAVCGGVNRFVGKPEHGKLIAILPTGALAAATREVIERRDDLLSRARIEAESLPASSGRSGTILGKYEIVRAISVGGMAEVFLAVQKGIGGFAKPVALKRIRRSVLEHRHFAVEQFLNEAKIAATLAHPNIAQIFDVGEEDGVLYLAMEFVHGKDLRVFGKRLRDHESGTPVPLAMALYVVRQIALALHHAYTTVDLNGRQLKAIHRDVSPHNILCGFDGTIKLVDFGVATSAATARHDPTAMAGKRHYIAPEQLSGGTLDARSDLFSLGVVLYELLTGQRPFKQESEDASQTTAKTGVYKPVSQLRPDLGANAGASAGIDAMIARLLAAKPSERYSDGNKLADEIQRFAAQQNVTLSGDWLRTTMPTLFPATSEEIDAQGAPIDTTHTPRSNSFSLYPTVDRMRHATNEPAAPAPHAASPDAPAPIPAPLRPSAARAASAPRTPTPELGAAMELDEQTVSRILAQAPKPPRSRVIYVFVLAAAIAALVLLWTRY